MALSPALYAAEHEVHHLVVGHAYSNQLLAANVDTGACTLVTEMESRPSAVFCDGDYIAAGDGCGTIELFRGTTLLQQGGTSSSLLWKRRCGRSSVAALCISRNSLIVGFADYSTMVVSLRNGEATASLLHEASVAAALMPVMGDRLSVLTKAGALTLFSADDWIVCGIVNLRTPATCATVDMIGLMVIGTSNGSVIILNAAGPVPEELVRFDVQQPVAGVQVYENSRSLVVVTRTGDVWRWGIDEILSQGMQPAAAAAGDDDQREQPAPEMVVPKPTTSSHSTPAKSYPIAHTEGIQGDVVDDDTMPQLDDTEVEQVIEMFEDDEAEEEQRRRIRANEQALRIASAVALAVHEVDADEAARRGAPVQRSSSVGEDRRSVGVRTDDSCQPPPSSVVAMSQQQAGFDTSATSPQQQQQQRSQQERRGGETNQAPNVVSNYDVSIEGLKEGRRMNPRVARYALEQRHIRSQCDVAGVVRSEANESQAAVIATRKMMEDETFDPTQYAREHPAEAQGLRFRHPVPAVSFSRSDAVFSSVGLTNQHPNVASTTLSKQQKDDLVSATFDKFSRRRDEQFEQLRQRPGPNIRSHMLGELMFAGPSTSILFSEYHVRPEAPPLLLAGMPMPPTPLTY